ncbi:hypothetical protein K3175_07790 [Qipengyuania sp. GH1]|uniref:hypothetical protein n=1 Tax=Qipengyuania aestuarii TaxID=2867241 RepID=UPI001C88A91B|nr:hypothetical protein [Qipengyuania aestuarii]MBX7535559.1 hypothetical protein [Qipengyuania aestuarii]
MTKWYPPLAGLLVLAVTPATAQESTDNLSTTADPLEDLLACQAIAQVTDRVSCYDEATSRIERARADREIVLVTKEEVRAAQRGLFGLAGPEMELLDEVEDHFETDQSLREMTGTIAAIGRNRHGLVLRLGDGAVWEQTDKVYLGNVKVGDSIVITRAALGSYLAKVDGSRGARVRRVK